MFGGLGGLNPAKMKGLMKQMGIEQKEIDNAKRVVIECDDRKIVIDEPSVQKISAQGQESWQIVGEAREEGLGASEDDIKLVMEKTGRGRTEAKKALEEAGGDIAEAIVKIGG
jgi:nascent polypeptide-associated complex subunit alpha